MIDARRLVAPREHYGVLVEPDAAGVRACLARDAAALVAGGYSLERLQVVNMFPQSAHVESLLWLRREEQAT